MPKYGLIACFSPVIKGEWLPVRKNWELENGKKLAIQKVAKTGNIGKKKLQWPAISIK